MTLIFIALKACDARASGGGPQSRGQAKIPPAPWGNRGSELEKRLAPVYHQSSGVGAVTSGVPAEGTAACNPRVDSDRFLQMFPFCLLGKMLVVNPAIAMTGNL